MKNNSLTLDQISNIIKLKKNMNFGRNYLLHDISLENHKLINSYWFIDTNKVFNGEFTFYSNPIVDK